MNHLELNIPGLSIACRTWGKKENPPVLALHGWLDNANSFEAIANYLQEQYYFIAVDLPGHGLSSHLPIGVHYHFIDGLFTIIQIIKALKLNKVHLLGHSLGACLGSLLAGIAPDYISSLSLIEGLGPLTSPAESTADQLSHFASNLNINNKSPPKGYKNFESAAQARALRGYVSLDIAKKLCERGLIEKEGLYYWRHDRRLLSHSPLQMIEAQVLPCLKKISAPTLLVWANEGFSFNNELMKQRINAVNNLTIEYLVGGHHVHMEQPEAVARLLAEFYRPL
jgi:pimeloyl-ACP methyl ester carboxylesterase